MKLKFNHILIIIIIVLLGIGYFVYNNLQQEIKEANEAARTEFLRNDELKEIADGWYQKYVADTATISELREITDSLKIEVNNPKIVEVIRLVPADTVKETDTIRVNEGMAHIVDYYPSKENYFLKYTNDFSLETLSGTSKFQWSDITINGVISEEDGLFKLDLQTPDFIKVGDIDIQATPLEPKEKDNFGILVGGGYGKDFGTNTNYVEIGGGIRYKKIYLDIEGNTNKQADIGIKYEF